MLRGSCRSLRLRSTPNLDLKIRLRAPYVAPLNMLQVRPTGPARGSGAGVACLTPSVDMASCVQFSLAIAFQVLCLKALREFAEKGTCHGVCGRAEQAAAARGEGAGGASSQCSVVFKVRPPHSLHSCTTQLHHGAIAI